MIPRDELIPAKTPSFITAGMIPHANILPKKQAVIVKENNKLTYMQNKENKRPNML